jgi:aspartate racemase
MCPNPPSTDESAVRVHVAEPDVKATAAPGEHASKTALKAEKDRATIGIRCTDFTTGAQFYRTLQALMAELYPNEYDRPKIFLDLGGTQENSSALLTTHRKKFDVVLIPHRQSSDANQDGISFTPKKLIKLIYPKADVGDKLNHLEDMFKAFNVDVVSSNQLDNKAQLEKSTVVGIVGGMGPEADGYTLERIVTHHRDEKLRVYLMSDPRVPRSTDHFLKLHKLINYEDRLKNFLEIPEVSVFIVPSNTFHTGPQFAWAQNESGHKMFSIIDSVSKEAKTSYQGTKIGLLATGTTAKSGIYRDRLIKAGADVVQPDEAFQTKVDDGIKAMKSGNIERARELFIEVIDQLKAQGATVILLGCTEIPLALENVSLPSGLKYIDSADILSRAVLSSLTLDPYREHYIQFVSDSLKEYLQLKDGKASDSVKSLYKAMQAAKGGNDENFNRLELEVKRIISEKGGYDPMHFKKKPKGMHAILETNLAKFRSDMETKNILRVEGRSVLDLSTGQVTFSHR